MARRHPALLFLCALILLPGLTGATASAANTPQAASSPTNVLDTPKGHALADDRRWLRLLAYEHRAFRPGKRGMVETPGFYWHPDGREDPAAELEATLEALFAPVIEGLENEHAACRHPARRQFLVETLAIDQFGVPLPAPECTEYEEWRERIDTERVVLVYADAYMGNPASMFGHTLLRLDGQAALERPLTAFAVNHAAQTGEDHGVIFAMRGVLGAYPGTYSVMPYYFKVNEYTQLEQRDLWEYELALDDEAINRLLAHLWELDEAGMPYYFFLQNCSYRLLSLLEIADPELDLLADFRLWAIPVDTIRAVEQAPGLVRDVEYRPSRRRTLDHMLAELDPSDAALAEELARGEIAPDDPQISTLSENDQGRLFEAASAYMDQLAQIEPTDESHRQRRHQLLSARARVDSPRVEPPDRPERRPEQGHRTGRLGIGVGGLSEVAYAEVQWRAAYHDLLDPLPGYLRGAQVSFLELVGRLYADDEPRRGTAPDGGLELERLRIMELRSLEARNQAFPGWAWGGRLGFERHRGPAGDRPMMLDAAADFGAAWTVADGHLRAYLGGSLALRAASELDDRVRAGAGPRTDLVYQGQAWRAHFYSEAHRFSDGDNGWSLNAYVSRDTGAQSALRAGVGYDNAFDVATRRLSLIWHRYL